MIAVDTVTSVREAQAASSKDSDDAMSSEVLVEVQLHQMAGELSSFEVEVVCEANAAVIVLANVDHQVLNVAFRVLDVVLQLRNAVPLVLYVIQWDQDVIQQILDEILQELNVVPQVSDGDHLVQDLKKLTEVMTVVENNG